MKIVSLGICICLTLSGGGSNFFIGEMPYQVHAAENETTLEEDELYAQAAVLMDAATGRILFGKNEAQIMANASTTKIMTALVALDRARLTDTITVTAAHMVEGSSMYLKPGETVTVEEPSTI